MVTTEFGQLQQGERTLDGSETDDEESAAVERVDRRQLLLVACCLAAVLVAAVLAPTPVDPDVPTPEQNDTPTPRERSGGDLGGGDGRAGDSNGDSRVVGGEGTPVPIPGDTAPPTTGCGVLLEDEPIPGSRATVGVFRDGEPVPGVRVRFNGEPVGRTGERGRVSGAVPYERALRVSVGLDADCEFYRERFDEERAGALDASGGRPRLDAAALAARADTGQSGTDTRAGTGQSGTDTPATNNTGRYAVRGDVELTVRGDAYPGTEVTVLASVEGVPMRGANVRLDESTVGETGADGTANLTVPDGNQEAPVTVSRGDFEGRGVVDVLLLTAALEPQEGFPVPGEPVDVVAEVDERPTSDVSVRVAGRAVGSTASDGRLGFGLPPAPAGTVVASTSRQSASVPLWTVYVPTVLNLFVLVAIGVVATAGAQLLRGRTAATRVAVAWAAVAVADLALIVGEWRGLGLSLVAIAVVGVVYQRRRVVAGGEEAIGTARGVVAAVHGVALWVTDLLLRTLDRVGQFLGRAWTRLTSFEHLAAWLGGLARRAVATVWLYLTLRRVGVAGFALAELAVATVRWGHEGLIASVAGLGILAALVALWRRDDTTTAPVDTGGGEVTRDRRVGRTTADDAGESEERVFSLRELWRQFARRVVPGSWRTRTPGEVARAAVDRGFPREPVEELTDAFRDVEYGAESATTRRERAKAAFDSLEAATEEDEE